MAGGPAESPSSNEERQEGIAAEMAHDVTEHDSVDSDLPPEQALCVRLALEGKSQQEIADEIGYSRRQVIRWMARKEVRDAIRDGAQEGLSRARMVLSGNSVVASAALVAMAAGPGVDGGAVADPAQVGAAKAVLEMAIKLGEYAGDAAAAKQDIHVSGGMTVAQMNSEQRAKRRAELDEKVKRAKEQAAKSASGTVSDDSDGDAT